MARKPSINAPTKTPEDKPEPVKSPEDKPETAKKPAKKAAKKVVKKKKKKKKKAYYVNPAEFLADIEEYYVSDDLTNKLGEAVYKIATGLSYAPNFINYSYKDDMIGDAVMKMVAALRNKKFNIDSGNNPFSYFTTIAFHAFINRIKKEKKHRETITQYQEKVYFDLASSEYGDLSQQGDVGEDSSETPDY
jgi:hypothetical protein